MKSKYKISQTNLDNTLLRLVLSPINKPLGTPLGGQYLYMSLGFFGQRHPFSVLDYNIVSGDIQLSIRVVGDFTDRISKLQIGDKVNLDGYYGHYTQNLDTNTPTLLIAGGVGIVPFWSMINKHPNNLNLIYCTSSLSDSVNLKTLSQLLGKRLNHHIGDQNRLTPNDIKQVIDTMIENDSNQKDKIQAYICAGKNLTAMVNTELNQLGLNPKNIHIEEFGY